MSGLDSPNAQDVNKIDRVTGLIHGTMPTCRTISRPGGEREGKVKPEGVHRLRLHMSRGNKV